MKPVSTTIAAVLLVSGLGVGAARAVPRAESAAGAPATAERVHPVRLVCNDRRCWHTGSYRGSWYRPYGYYRPYSGPRVGVGVGPFGIGID